MTQPITVYPTETPGLYRTERGRDALRRPRWPAFPGTCARCHFNFQYRIGPQWYVDGDFYCKNCVVVAGQEKGHG